MPEIKSIGLAVAVALPLLIFCFCFILILRNRLLAAKSNRVEMRDGILHVPLVAAFSGWRGVPWIARSTNSINPVLQFHLDHLECRVLRTRRKSYDQIRRVDYRRTIGTENIVLEFSGSLRSFVGNTANRDVVRDAIAFLADRGCPLSRRAAALLATRSEPADGQGGKA